MAYQNVGTPRFYIDQAEYLKSIGFDFQEVIENSTYSEEKKDAIINGGHYAISEYNSIINRPELFSLNPINQKFFEYTGVSTGAQNYHFVFPTGYSGEQNLEGDNIGRYFALLNLSLIHI